MKKFIEILGICLALTLSHIAVGQNSRAGERPIKKKGPNNETAQITADLISTDGQTVTYIGNVSVKTDRLTAQGADKATLDIKTKKITIWNTNERFKADYKTRAEDHSFYDDRVEYTPGSRVVVYTSLPK